MICKYCHYIIVKMTVNTSNIWQHNTLFIKYTLQGSIQGEGGGGGEGGPPPPQKGFFFPQDFQKSDKKEKKNN